MSFGTCRQKPELQTPEMAEKARPVSGWRRYLRLSVRGLLILVLLIGGWLGWLAQTARTQREAVAAILKAHGAIRYDWQGASFASGEPAQPMATRWLARTIGQDYLHSVVLVALPARLFMSPPNDGIRPYECADFVMAQLKGLTKLLALDLSGSDVTESGLSHLEGLTELSDLQLGFTQATDSAIAHVRGLANLSDLNLRSTRVTDAGLSHLTGLTKLSALDLVATRITDAGLAHLKSLRDLKTLELRDTQVTDTGARELQKALPNLKIIR
jgi:hypothetical protein